MGLNSLKNLSKRFFRIMAVKQKLKFFLKSVFLTEFSIKKHLQLEILTEKMQNKITIIEGQQIVFQLVV